MDKELINTISMSVILPLLIALAGYTITFIKAKADELRIKTNNKGLQRYIDTASSAIEDCVVAVSQTFVDSLKKRGEFTPESAKEAFNLARSNALLIISLDSKKAIQLVYGDFDAWMRSQIEKFVKYNNF